jgi:hypothetical protein
MNLKDRIKILEWLRNYLLDNPPAFGESKEEAFYRNSWFTPEFIDLSVSNITRQFLDPNVLAEAISRYQIPDQSLQPKTIGIVMAGNIPLVGFHDFLLTFLAGHKQLVKLSSRDQIMLPHLTEAITSSFHEFGEWISFADSLKGCDAYIATGSNNTARYFEQYFAKYPHVIRKNRTGIAILDGTESEAELESLSDDIQLYYGLGCRNITQVWVPAGYDFTQLLKALDKYDYFLDNHKYKNNYDFVLTVNMMNKEAYFTNDSIVISPGSSPFAGISNLKYAYYKQPDDVISTLNPDEVQVICGHHYTAFGQAQCPGFFDYADGVDTLRFLTTLH